MSETPPEPRDVTSDWLEGVLRERGVLRQARVDSLALEHVGTFTNDVWRLRPGYDRREPGAPDSLILKRARAGREQRSGEEFALEVRFYRELAPELPARAPRCYFGGDEPGTLLLEEVPHLLHFDFRAGADTEHARLGLEALARIHAHWWEATAALDWIPRLADPALRATWGREYDQGWSQHRELFSELVPGFAAIGDALVGALPRTLAPLAERATLLHGDPHAENLPLCAPPGRARDLVVLDWPGPRRGLASFDVAVFVAMSFTVEERRKREQALVALHADAVRSAGVRDWPDPWRDYRLGVLRRAARIVEIASSFGGTPVSERALRMVAERCATAAADLGVGELIPS